METIREERDDTSDRVEYHRGKSITERLAELEEEKRYRKEKAETELLKKEIPFPNSWKKIFRKSEKKSNIDMVIIELLNVKNEIEPLTLAPLYDGSMVIHKNKAYDFDPRALYTIKIKNKMYKVLVINERDRRPVSNLNWDEIKQRGDSTDSDEIILKMIKRAQIDKIKKAMSASWILWVIIAGVIGLVIYLMVK